VGVTSSVQLPEQPASGFVEEVALAGNGYHAPHSETHVKLQLDADVSGALWQTTITFDPKWSSLIAYVHLEFGSLLDTKIVACRTQLGPDMFLGQNVLIPPSFESLPENNQGLWVPPAQLYFAPGMPGWQPNITVRTDNTDTENGTVFLLLYNFKKDAGKRVPLSVIYSCLPRASSS